MTALRPGWLDEAPSSPVLPAWARAALASSPPREGPRSSPCPEAEQRAREVAAVEEWEVEEDSGPVTLGPADVAGVMTGREEESHG